MQSIFLDMDGVLVSLVPEILALFNVPREYWMHVKTWDGMPRAINRYFAETDQLHTTVGHGDIWDKVGEQGDTFWANLPWTPDGSSIYRACARRAPVVLMSTPTYDPGSAAGKVKWINSNKGLLEYLSAGCPSHHKPPDRRYSLTPCKDLFAENRVLVDDNRDNCDSFIEAGGKAFCWPMPWNDPDWDKRDRIAELEEFLDEASGAV